MRRKSLRTRWVLLALVALLVVLAAGTLFATRLIVNQWQDAFATEELLAPEARGPQTPRQATVTGPLTFLLIGSDRRVENPAAGHRADTIMIVHIAADLRTMYLVSVPRDLLVPIPGYGQDKINAAYQFGGGGDKGAQLLSTTLNNLTGVGFDGAAILDFGGFEKVVDSIGGVDICLEQRVGSLFAAGCQHLTGAQALNLARQRHDLPRGDFDRMRHQQQLLLAMVDQMATANLLTDPFQLVRTIRAVQDALTLDTGGTPLYDLVSALRRLRGDQIIGITVPSQHQMIDGTSYMLADPAASGLYRAIRDSTLADWAAANPSWRNH